MFRLLLIGLVLFPLGPAYGAQSTERDSLNALADARGALRSHIRQLRRIRPSPGTPRIAREARPKVIRRLDDAGTVIPGNAWIVGHRIGLRVMQGELDQALAMAEVCRAEPWWCDALRGFVLHAREEFVEAESAFDASVDGMPADLHCEWLEELPRFLLGGESAREFRRLACPEQIEEERRVWWLADPLYLIAGNDRKTEHYARMVAMELHHQWLALEGSTCSPAHHEAQVKQGWPDWWWSVERTNRHLGDGSGYRFIARGLAGLNPLESVPGDWSLDGSSSAEWYDPPYGPIYPLEPQTAFFRRGDRFLAAVAVDIAGLELEADAIVDAALVLTREPDELHPGVREETSDGSRYLFEAMVPAEPHVLSIELLSSEDGAARGRFAHGLPGEPSEGLDLSDILLWDWSEGVNQEVDAVLPRMLGSSHVPADQEVGVFWELYGAAPGDAIDVSISAQPQDRGLLSRVTDLLRITSPPEGLRLEWSEGMSADEAPARGRTLALNLSQLRPGRYTLELQVSGESGDPVIRTKEIELYR
ncbi:MAG: hypothetical protein GEU90_04295 [Gemmatimonas sp.]|nr:hypothetical protein [Gemmatimonas sp.]